MGLEDKHFLLKWSLFRKHVDFRKSYSNNNHNQSHDVKNTCANTLHIDIVLQFWGLLIESQIILLFDTFYFDYVFMWKIQVSIKTSVIRLLKDTFSQDKPGIWSRIMSYFGCQNPGNYVGK